MQFSMILFDYRVVTHSEYITNTFYIIFRYDVFISVLLHRADDKRGVRCTDRAILRKRN